jgi:hypothetical protein
MKTMLDNLRGRAAGALLVPVLLAAGMFLGGCESDATAPQDPTPALTERDAANQAGYVAMAVAQVGPTVVTFSEIGKNVYTRSFIGDVSGTVALDFRLGGPDGTPATWSAGDWARLYTEVGEPLNFAIGSSGGVTLTLNITADINQGLDSAVLGGGGSFQSGVHLATFAFTDLAVTAAGDYPTGGTMSFTGGGFAMTVAFNGTNLATITVTGHGVWTLNLDTGILTPQA